MTDDRGVSELVSFVLVFALVISTVSLVYALGYPALLHVQDVERSTNAERAMTTVADAVTEVTVRGAPSRATEMKLSEASLSFGDPVTITVNGDSRESHPLVYEGADGTRIVYVGGAVFREQADGGFVVVRDSEMLVSGSETVIVVPITASASSTDAVAGQTDVLVRLERGQVATATTDGDVTIEIHDSPHADAWRAYLASQPGTTCSSPVGASPVVCTVDSDRSSVTFVEVRVELE